MFRMISRPTVAAYCLICILPICFLVGGSVFIFVVALLKGNIMYGLCFLHQTTSIVCLVNWMYAWIYVRRLYSNTIQTLTTHGNASWKKTHWFTSVYPVLPWSMSKVLNFGMHFKMRGWTMTRLFFLWQVFKSLTVSLHVVIPHILCVSVSMLSIILSAVHSSQFVWQSVIILKMSSI